MTWQTIFSYLWAHPFWSGFAFLAIIWGVGKTYEKLTTPTHEETMRILDNTIQIMNGTKPAPDYPLRAMLWDDFKEILLWPFTVVLFPFAFIYEKIEAVFDFIHMNIVIPIQAIHEGLRAGFKEVKRQAQSNKDTQINNSQAEENKQTEDIKTESA